MSSYKLAKPLAVVCLRQNNRWLLADISTDTCADLFVKYKNIQIAITDIFERELTLNLFDYQLELNNYRFTIEHWLDDLDDQALTLTKNYPALKVAQAYYIPGCLYSGEIKLTKENTHPSQEVPLDDCTDLVVKYDGVNMEQLSKNTLWSCNGYYFRSFYSGGFIRLPNAGKAIIKSGRMDFGCLNFEKVGQVTTKPLTKDMIFKIDTSLKYDSRLHIDTKENLSQKSVGIVIGGYLHLVDDYLKVTSYSSIAITLNLTNILNRVIQSKQTLDMSFMHLDDLADDSNVKDILNDNNILQYLISNNSFLVFIDNPYLYKDKIEIDNNSSIGTSITDANLTPSQLIGAYGKAIDYWYTIEANKRCLQYADLVENQYLFYQTSWKGDKKINNARVGNNITKRIKPYYLNYQAKV